MQASLFLSFVGHIIQFVENHPEQKTNNMHGIFVTDWMGSFVLLFLRLVMVYSLWMFMNVTPLLDPAGIIECSTIVTNVAAGS